MAGGRIFALGILQASGVGSIGLAYLLFAAIEVAVGAGLIAFAVGALRMRHWAWPLGFVLVGVGSLFWLPALMETDQAAAAAWGFTSPLLGEPLLLALLILLLVPSVRTALGHPPKERHSTHAIAH